MSDFEISSDLKQFILDNMDSVAQLEALLLCRTSPATDWTVDVVARRLYITSMQADEILNRLHASGLLDMNPGNPNSYSYRPASPTLAILVDNLLEAYSRHLVPVTNLIHSKSKTKIQQFADAFKFRKEEI